MKKKRWIPLITILFILVTFLVYLVSDNKTKLSLIDDKNKEIEDLKKQLDVGRENIPIEAQRIKEIEIELETKQQEIERLTLETKGFYYEVSVSRWSHNDEQLLLLWENLSAVNNFSLSEDTIMIRQIYPKSSPCTSMNYTLTKTGNEITVLPIVIPNEDRYSTCVAMMDYDDVEIYLKLIPGSYNINFYEFWNQTSPFLSKSFIIE